jgi:hypothetical protein
MFGGRWRGSKDEHKRKKEEKNSNLEFINDLWLKGLVYH